MADSLFRNRSSDEIRLVNHSPRAGHLSSYTRRSLSPGCDWLLSPTIVVIMTFRLLPTSVDLGMNAATIGAGQLGQSRRLSQGLAANK